MNTLTKEGFFKDDHGKTVIWQWPNVPLYGWLLFKLVSMVLHNNTVKHGTNELSMAFLFTWAYLEITQGVNYFRRLLGAVVMVALVIGFFR